MRVFDRRSEKPGFCGFKNAKCRSLLTPAAVLRFKGEKFRGVITLLFEFKQIVARDCDIK
jgi:hypothetical protein